MASVILLVKERQFRIPNFEHYTWKVFLFYFFLLFQVEMTGSSFFDYIHHADHTEVAEQLGLGLSQGQNIASPNSANSEEGVSNTGTANPDGELPNFHSIKFGI